MIDRWIDPWDDLAHPDTGDYRDEADPQPSDTFDAQIERDGAWWIPTAADKQVQP